MVDDELKLGRMPSEKPMSQFATIESLIANERAQKRVGVNLGAGGDIDLGMSPVK